MKPVHTGGVPWMAHPWLPSALLTPGENGAVGPLHGRNDHGEGMPPEATRTPAATQEEVIPGECQQEPEQDDGRGSVEPA